MKNKNLSYKFYVIMSLSIAAIPVVFIVLSYAMFFTHLGITSLFNIDNHFSGSVLTTYFYIVFFGILFGLMFIAAKYFKKIIHRINTMEQTVRKIAEDDAFPEKLAVIEESEDELNKLAASINTMIDRLRAKEIELSQMEDLKREYLKQLSHDINTPLNALNLELYLYSQNHNVSKEEVDVLYQKVDYISKLVNSISSETLFDIDNYYIFKEDISVHKSLKQTINKWSYLLNKNNIEYTIDVQKNLIWQANELWLDRLFENIISNIFKHSATNQIVITVGDTLIIKDYGVGFEIDRDHETTGLSVIKNICQKLNIQLDIESTNAGTAYRLSQE